MDCLYEYSGLCLIRASGQVSDSFFGFSEFIGAFALLAIVFTIADVQYRFRISVAPLPLPLITFCGIVLIGLGTLVADVWVAEGWLVIYVPYMTYPLIQGLFAGGFLLIAMAWLYFAFVKPPVFTKWNAKKYGQTLYHYILRGSDSELPVIAKELGRSAEKLMEIFAKHRSDYQKQKRQQERGEEVNPNPGNYASDILLMVGNRKFCRYVVAAAPGTAIRLFQEAEDKKAYDAPIGQFAKNISTEAIINPDSNLYHEDSHYQSGLLGHLKPFTQSIYGAYELVEALGNNTGNSPLHVEYGIRRNWSASELEAYARAVVTTYANKLQCGLWSKHSYSLNCAFDVFKQSSWGLYKLDGLDEIHSDSSDRLRVCVDFVNDLIEILEKNEDKVVITRSKPSQDRTGWDMYDNLADLMSEIIYNAAGVTKPWWPCWHIQHNLVWRSFFKPFGHSKTRSVIEFKLRRLIYEEIIEFDKYEDLKSFRAARFLGISLNCMGIDLLKNQRPKNSTNPLHKVVLHWVKKNFISLHDNHQSVAEACLMGGISYDAENKQLVKTYASHPDREPNRDYLMLSYE